MLEKDVLFRNKEDMMAELAKINSSDLVKLYLYAPLLAKAGTGTKAPSDVLQAIIDALEHFIEKAPQFRMAAMNILQRRGDDFIDALIDDKEGQAFTKILLKMEFEDLEKLEP